MYSAKPRRSKPVGWIRGILGGVVNSCRAFCLQTSIHGFNHIAAPRRHWLERLVWLCVTATAVWGTVDVSLGQWQRYQDNPTVVTLDKDFRTWTYTMPGVTACKPNRTSIEKVEKAIKLRWKVTPGHPKYSYYLRFVDVVANSDLYHLDGYREFANDSDLNVDLYQLAVEVMPDQRVKLMAAEQISSPAPRWTPVMTEVGACYTINSLASAEIAILKPGWNSTQDLPVTCQYSSQGCYFIFEYPDDNMSYYFHSAYDIPDTLTTPATTYPTVYIASDLSTMETSAEPGVRDLPPRRRYCRYTDEPTEPNRRESRDDVKSGQFAVHGAAAPHAVHKENRVPLPGPGCVVRWRGGALPGRQLHQFRGGRLLPRRTHPMHRRKEDGIQ